MFMTFRSPAKARITGWDEQEFDPASAWPLHGGVMRAFFADKQDVYA